MAAFQTVTSYLNAAFSRDNIGQIVPKRELFAPGRSLVQGVVIKEGTRLHALWVEYLGKLPRSVAIHHLLLAIDGTADPHRLCLGSRL